MARKPFDVEGIFSLLTKHPYSKSFAEIGQMTIYQVAAILLRPDDSPRRLPRPRK